jgi:ElaB/YqjD/DUF883 family membrane-anchored ribosome-binding protein
MELEEELVAKRSELQIVRDKVVDHIEAMNADLYAEIREMNARLALAGRAAKPQIADCIDHLQRELDELTDELEKLIEDRIEVFREQASQLKRKASDASGELEAAIQAHLLSIESQLRNERDDLGDSFEQRLLQTKQWFEVLRVRAAFASAEVRDRARDAIEKAQRDLTQLKALVRMRHRKDELAWKDVRHGFNKIWKELGDAFDQASRQPAA